MSIKSKIKHAISFLLHGEPDIVKANLATLAPNELLKGRCAIITGGTSGIGYSIAQSFLNAGASVIITGRSEEKLFKAKESLGYEGRVFAYVMNNQDVNSFRPTFDRMLADTKLGGGIALIFL